MDTKEKPIRLSKFLAQAGICSRRRADELIQEGSVVVNGQVAVLGQKIVPGKDEVCVEGQQVSGAEPKVCIMLNKPPGYLSSCSDPFGRPTVLYLIPQVKQRVYPVGRLDLDSEGLLLLTNDGTLAYFLTHPKYQVVKEYVVDIEGETCHDDINRLLSGIVIDGVKVYPDHARFLRSPDNIKRIVIGVHEGQKHLVKQLCFALGYDVKRLLRTKMGPLSLSGLDSGKWRYLDPKEVNALYKTALAGQEGEHNGGKPKNQISDS